jgi:two-component system, sensor histidine kinase LadS
MVRCMFKTRKKKFLWKLLLLPLSFFFFDAAAFGSQQAGPSHFIISQDLERHALTPHLSYFVDPSGLLGVKDVSVRPEAFSLLPNRHGDPSFGFSRSAYWLMLGVNNIDSAPIEWILELSYPLIDRVELFIPDGTSYRVAETGDRFLFNKREIPYRNFAFPLAEAPGEKTYFLKVQSGGGLTVPLVAWSPQRFLQKMNQEPLVLGFSYGILLAMVVYHLYIFLSIREESYLYLTFLIFFAGIFSMVNTGIAYQHLWPAQPTWANTAFPLFLAAGNLSALAFARAFLSMKSRFPRLDRLFLCVMAVAAAFIPLSHMVAYYHMSRATSVLTLVSGGMLIFAGIISLANGYRESRFYLMACLAFFIGSILTAVRGFGFLPETFVTAWSNQIGMVALALLFSLGVADKVQVLSKLASTDNLTGHFNRRVFMEKLDEEIKRCRRYGDTVVVMMMDLDHFKKVNDTFGHTGGDMVLSRFARMLKETVRTTDVPGRLGGDEFAVFLPETTLESASPLARRILGRVRETVVSTEHGEIRFTISIGIAELHSGDTHADHLLDRADAALYRAKNNGRDRSEISRGRVLNLVAAAGSRHLLVHPSCIQKKDAENKEAAS